MGSANSNIHLIAEDMCVKLVSGYKDELGHIPAGTVGQAVSSVRAGTVLVEFSQFDDDDRVRLIDVSALVEDIQVV